MWVGRCRIVVKEVRVDVEVVVATIIAGNLIIDVVSDVALSDREEIGHEG